MLPLLRLLDEAEAEGAGEGAVAGEGAEGEGAEGASEGEGEADLTGGRAGGGGSVARVQPRWSEKRLLRLGLDARQPFALHATAPSAELLHALRALLHSPPRTVGPQPCCGFDSSLG